MDPQNLKRNKQTFRKFSVKKDIQMENPAQWKQMDNIQQDDLDSFNSQKSPQSREHKRSSGPKTNNKRIKKATELQEYQNALIRLRKQNKTFYRPFDKQRLNISLMQAIKILRDAIDKDKDFTKTLRMMGCKTRMRVRNKSAARQLFQNMLLYIQEGVLPTWMKENHLKLLQKDDSKFDFFHQDERD